MGLCAEPRLTLWGIPLPLAAVPASCLMSHRRLAARAMQTSWVHRPKFAATRVGHCEQRGIQKPFVTGRARSAAVAEVHGLGSDGQQVWPRLAVLTGSILIARTLAWARIVAAAKLGSNVTPHVLRHTCVTWGLQSRMDVWDIASLTDMSTKMTEEGHGHHDPEFQASAAGVLRRQA